jgi:hypothetical protein
MWIGPASGTCDGWDEETGPGRERPSPIDFPSLDRPSIRIALGIESPDQKSRR